MRAGWSPKLAEAVKAKARARAISMKRIENPAPVGGWPAEDLFMDIVEAIEAAVEAARPVISAEVKATSVEEVA